MELAGETTPEAGGAGLNGYLVGTAIFGLLLIVLAWIQIRARSFNPWLYWATIIASTTAGTTLADFATRSLGIGYPGGSLLLFACVLLSLFGMVQIDRDHLGQLGRQPARRAVLLDHDHVFADPRHRAGRLDRRSQSRLCGRCGLSGAALLVLAGLYFWTGISRVFLFWAAFISRDRSGRRSATGSTSHLIKAGSTSAVPGLRWCWRWRSSRSRIDPAARGRASRR